MKRLPFLTRAEWRALQARTMRTPGGCLLFDPENPCKPNLVQIRGTCYCVTRLVWSETFVFDVASEQALETHEVLHIPTCAHPNTRGVDRICIEPTHLVLGTPSDRKASIYARQKSLGGRA